MTAEAPRYPVSTLGSWLGFATAAWSALVVWTGVALLAAVAAMPVALAQASADAEREAASSDFPTHVTQRLELLEEAWATLRPFGNAAGLAGIALGFALFVAGSMLVAGGDFGRRAARALLVADALYVIGAGAWLLALRPGLSDWNDRWRRAHEAFADASRDRLPADFGPVASRVGTSIGLGAAGALLVVSLLFWATGRPSVREWCAARRRYPVASPPVGR